VLPGEPLLMRSTVLGVGMLAVFKGATIDQPGNTARRVPGERRQLIHAHIQSRHTARINRCRMRFSPLDHFNARARSTRDHPHLNNGVPAADLRLDFDGQP